MKKLLAILLAIAMVMSLVACGAEPAGHSVKQAHYVSIQSDYVVSVSITVKDTEISEIESFFR